MKNQQLKLIDMRKATKGLAVLMLMMAAVCTTGCNKDGDSDDWSGNNGNSDVRVTTYSPQNITQTSVVCGGDAIVRQGLSLSELVFAGVRNSILQQRTRICPLQTGESLMSALSQVLSQALTIIFAPTPYEA